MNRLIVILSLAIFIMPSFVIAEPNNLQELLEQVKQERSQEKEELTKRELKFKKAKRKQQELLDTALKKLETNESRSETLRNNYNS